MNPLKSLINIILLLTLPVWGGFYILWCFSVSAFNGQEIIRETLRGERWLLE